MTAVRAVGWGLWGGGCGVGACGAVAVVGLWGCGAVGLRRLGGEAGGRDLRIGRVSFRALVRG